MNKRYWWTKLLVMLTLLVTAGLYMTPMTATAEESDSISPSASELVESDSSGIAASSPQWKRLAGAGRYDTMAAIVKEGWSGSTDTVIVATGTNYKDALAAAGLAGLYNSPVVLTEGKKLSSQAEGRLKALAPRKVYVAGGPVAISDTTLSQIRLATGADVDRIMGKTSAGTSAALARAGKGRWLDSTAIIATNKSFKDALSVAPLSYAKRWPILLADNGQSLSSEVVSALRDCGIKKVYIVGGELAVTPRVVSQLKSANITVNSRLAGKNGVATSRAIADFALNNGLGAYRMAFATSQNFPDALAGAALCGKNRAVLLLADDKAKDNISFAKDHASEIGTGYVFGGKSVFSDSLFARLSGNSPEAKFIKTLDGWWAHAGGLSSMTGSGYRSVMRIRNGSVTLYDGDGNILSSSSCDEDDVKRLKDAPGSMTGPGWYLFSPNGYFCADSDPNTLCCVNYDGSGYSGTSSYVRLDGEPDWHRWK